MTNRSILIMAGGTGGHVFPGLAVAHALMDAGWRVDWLGGKRGMENRAVPEQGIALHTLSIAGLRGGGLLRKLLMPLLLLVSFAQSLAILLRVRPDVVLGMGGYAAFPGGMMAALLGRPLVIHEQNAIAGLTNRVLAGVADRVLAAFPGAFRGEHDKPFLNRAQPAWVGNPVRADIAALPAPEARRMQRTGPPRVLVVGGSLGAAALNRIVPEALARLPADTRPEVMHQSGRDHIDALRAAYAQVSVTADCRAFIDDMAQAYAWCDVAICRAGAMTVSELAAAGVPALLVPYPHAVDDHQSANAKFLADAGAAVLKQQSDLSAAWLADWLASLDRAALLDMAIKARALAKPEATAEVARVCEELA
jgi:UDP-N-acetylglucosamine--N-acetylmuramyl-(pentapeptide) pyrophosphoryl-undecaprenol N-acetylglucosamine transferase